MHAALLAVCANKRLSACYLVPSWQQHESKLFSALFSTMPGAKLLGKGRLWMQGKNGKKFDVGLASLQYFRCWLEARGAPDSP